MKTSNSVGSGNTLYLYGYVPKAKLVVAIVGHLACEDNTPIANLAFSAHFHCRRALMLTPYVPSNKSVVCLAGHFIMATRDSHGAAWMSTCHSDCCSRQGQQDIINTVYRDEKQLTNVSIDFSFVFVLKVILFVSVITGEMRHFYSANQKSMNYSGSLVKCCCVMSKNQLDVKQKSHKL